MARFFNSRFFTTLEKLVDVMLIGLYFILCSIPVFTMGAALTGMYYAIHKSVYQNRGYTVEFFHSFKSNFKQATLSWLIFMGVFILGIADLHISKVMIEAKQPLGVSWVVFLAIMIIAALWALYHFVYIARFENTFWASFKVSGILMIANLPRTVLILILALAFGIVVYTIPLIALIAPALYITCVHQIFEKIFRPFMTEEDQALEDERNIDAID